MVVWRNIMQAVLIIALVVLALFGSLYFNIFNLTKTSVPADVIKASRELFLVEVKSDGYISFPLLTSTKLIKLATNAEFSDKIDLRESSNKEPYLIEVSAYDINGNLVEKREIHVFSRTQFFFDEKWGMYLPSFYLDSNALPSETRLTTLNFSDTKAVYEIRLRRLDTNSNLKAIYARIYQPAKIPESQLNFYWSNLKPEDQDRLASFSIYPTNLLSKSERMNTVRNLWTIVGPSGIPGKDFNEKILYRVNNPKGLPYDMGLLYSGNYVDNYHQIIVPITEDNFKIKVELMSADIIYPRYMKIWLGEIDSTVSSILKNLRSNDSINTQLSRVQRIDIDWRGRGLGATSKNSIDMKERRITKKYNFDAGLLTISSNFPAYVNLIKETRHGDEAITLSPNNVNLVKLDPAKPLIYEVFHDSSSAIPFRLDVRKISSQFFDQTMVDELTCELLDRNENVLSREIIKIAQPTTKFDFVSKKGNLNISDKQRMYFVFSQDVAYLRLSGPENLYVAVYNRLDSIDRKYIIPDDYRLAESMVKSLRRTWFYKTPVDYQELRDNQRTLLIKTQPRVLDEDPLIKAGVYDWQDILPEGTNWEAYQILEQAKTKTTSRPEAASSIFTKIPTNQLINLEIKGVAGKQHVNPTLIYTSPTAQGKAIIELDNKEFYKFNISNNSGEIALPNIHIGKHNILIKSDQPIETLMNQYSTDNEGYIKRTLVKLGKDNKQYFAFNKEDDTDKTVTIYFYSTSGKPRTINTEIHAENIQMNKPLTGYTTKKRKYEIHFTDHRGQKFISANSYNGNLFASNPVFIKLGSDLPKGRHVIEITSEAEKDSGDLLINMSSITSGLVDNVTMSIEVEDDVQ